MTLSKRIALFAVIVAACAQRVSAQTSIAEYQRRFAALATASGLSDSARFRQLLDLDWEYTNVTFPEFGTYTGYPGQNDRWTDLSVSSIRAQQGMVKTELATLRPIDRSRLNAADQLSYDIFKRQLEEGLEGQRFPANLLQVDQRNGPQYSASTLESSPQSTVRDFENIIVDLDRQIATEEDRTRVKDPGHPAYSTLAVAAAKRRQNLLSSLSQVRSILEVELREPALAANSLPMVSGVPSI